MENGKKILKGKDLAYWLADKIHAFGDYAKEAAQVLQSQANEIEQLRSEIESLKKAQQWISVDERLPEVEKNRIGYFIVALKTKHDGKVYSFECAYLNERVLNDESGDELDEPFTGWYSEVTRDGDEFFEKITHGTVTHWMTRPSPPDSEVK